MEVAEIKKLPNGNWYTITGKISHRTSEFEYYLMGEGDIETVIAACKYLIEIFETNKQ